MKRKMVKAKKKTVVAKKKTSPRKKSVKKTKKVSYIPKGYNTLTPYLIIDQAAKAIDFYKRVFGAKEVLRMEHNGKVGHAELKIGDSKFMLADEYPEMNAISPQKMGGTAVGIHLYVKNVDDILNQAVAAGAKLLRPAEDMFYGDRIGSVEDPFGHKWHVATHIEDVTPAKMRKRAAEACGNKEK